MDEYLPASITIIGRQSAGLQQSHKITPVIKLDGYSKLIRETTASCDGDRTLRVNGSGVG